MHRWWLLLAGLTMLTLAGISAQQTADWVLVVAFGIVFLIMWVPSLVLSVYVPRLRGGIAMIFATVGLGGVVLPPMDLGPYEWPILFGIIFGGMLVGGRVKVPVRFSGRVRIARPVREVAEIIRLGPKRQTWQRIVERIERHPEDPERLRAFLAPPISKQLPHFDIEVLSDDRRGNQSWRNTSANKMWTGSVCRFALEDADGETRVIYEEQSRIPILGWVVSWLDCAGQDAMHELKFYAELQSNWTIRAGDGRWWPTWSPPPDAAVF